MFRLIFSILLQKTFVILIYVNQYKSFHTSVVVVRMYVFRLCNVLKTPLYVYQRI